VARSGPDGERVETLVAGVTACPGWRPGLSRPAVRPAPAFPWRLAGARTCLPCRHRQAFLSASRASPAHPADKNVDKNVRAPSATPVHAGRGKTKPLSWPIHGHGPTPQLQLHSISGVFLRCFPPPSILSCSTAPAARPLCHQTGWRCHTGLRGSRSGQEGRDGQGETGKTGEARFHNPLSLLSARVSLHGSTVPRSAAQSQPRERRSNFHQLAFLANRAMPVHAFLS
jgi:hypothetical protein